LPSTPSRKNIAIRVQLEPPNQPEVISLIAQLDAYQDTLYPAEARYALDLSTLQQENVLFAVARDHDGTTIGCGAVVLGGESGELKRMFVRPANRAQGVAAQVLTQLEVESAKRGCRLVQLETGPYQPEALAFYKKHGFQTCGAFGDYPEHPLSVFMQKRLSGPVRLQGIGEPVAHDGEVKSKCLQPSALTPSLKPIHNGRPGRPQQAARFYDFNDAATTFDETTSWSQIHSHRPLM
jgi:putative acetyltransferase